MCLSEATCQPADCCFSELALYEFNLVCWSRTKRISSSSHWKLTCSRHDIAEKVGVKQQSLTQFTLNSEGLWCLAPLEQYFSYIVPVSFIGGGNRSTQKKPPTFGKLLTNVSHNVVSSTPRHQPTSKSQL